MSIDTEQLVGALEGARVEVLDAEGSARSSRRRGTPRGKVAVDEGTGTSEIVLRLFLESALARGMPGGPPAWAAAVRNALVHEGRLRSVVLKNTPLLDVDSLLAFLVAALEGMRAPYAGSPRRQFTESELAELRREGVELAEDPAPGGGVAAKTAAEFAALMATAFSVSEAATQLGVDDSRVRQRLAKRTLYGIKSGGTWRLPQFQFASGGQVPGIDQVLQALPISLHAVAVQRWLTNPMADLELDGSLLSPIAWLGAGGDPLTLTEIARDL